MSQHGGLLAFATRYAGTHAAPALRRHLAAPEAIGIAIVALTSGSLIAAQDIVGLYLCLSFIGAALILFDFRVGVVLIILLLPISGSTVFPHEILGIRGLNPLNILLLATLGAFMLTAIFDGSLRMFLPPALLWLYILPILAGGIVGAGNAGNMLPGFYDFGLTSFNEPVGYLRDMIVKPLLIVVFALLVAAAVARSKRPELFLIPAFFSIWIMGGLVVAYVTASGSSLRFLSQSTAREFLTPLGMHANGFGQLYTIAYGLLLFTWGAARQYSVRVLLFTSMLLVAGAVILTFSRAAFVGIVSVNLIYLLHKRNTRATVFVSMLAAAGLFALPDAVYDRLSMGFGSGLNVITAGRLDGLWLPLLPELLTNPLSGNGIGSLLWSQTMRTAGGASVLPVTHPHSAYLETLLDVGFVGFSMFAAYGYLIWRSFWRLNRSAELNPLMRGFYAGAAVALISLLLTNLVGGSFVPRPEHFYLWLAIGCMYGQLRKTEARQ